MVEIVIPELDEMRTAHVVSIGSEAAASLTPDLQDGYVYSLFSVCFLYISYIQFITNRCFLLS